jgi:hypothetical protein
MLKDGDDISEHLFAFDPADDLDRTLVEQVGRFVRGLLARPDATPRQVWSLAKLLLGIRRLPLVTPGLDVSVRLALPDGQPACELTLMADRFYVAQYLAEDGAPFEVDLEYRCEAAQTELSWLQHLPEMADDHALFIEDLSEDGEIDW